MARLSNASTAAMLCSDNKFQSFLCLFIYNGADLYGCTGSGIRMTTNTPESCRFTLCWLLEVESRKELNDIARSGWELLYQRFKIWRHRQYPSRG